MRRLALLTTLVVAASSAAYASPHQANPDRVADDDRYGDRDDRYRDRYDRYDQERWERDRYDRYGDSRWAREYRSRWVPLAWRYSADSNRQFINLRGRGGRFTKLRIEADRGAPVINQVAIEYLDGVTQKVRLDTRLPRGAGEVIRLNGRSRIQRIIVYTEPGYRGQYSVYGT